MNRNVEIDEWRIPFSFHTELERKVPEPEGFLYHPKATLPAKSALSRIFKPSCTMTSWQASETLYAGVECYSLTVHIFATNIKIKYNIHSSRTAAHSATDVAWARTILILDSVGSLWVCLILDSVGSLWVCLILDSVGSLWVCLILDSVGSL